MDATAAEVTRIRWGLRIISLIFVLGLMSFGVAMVVTLSSATPRYIVGGWFLPAVTLFDALWFFVMVHPWQRAYAHASIQRRNKGVLQVVETPRERKTREEIDTLEELYRRS